MIRNKRELMETLNLDSKNYQGLTRNKFIHTLRMTPISDQIMVWAYIKEMRHNEYHLNKNYKSTFLKIWRRINLIISNFKLRKLAYKTGLQIAPNTIDSGLTIWHMGPIIINGRARIGKNATIHPMVVIGYKNKDERAATIGDNVYICAGVKIIGNITIGNNVTIAPNSVVTKDFPDNVIIGGIPAKIIKYKSC